MEIQDYIKLIYQNEFGGGHMISDASKSLKMIIDEKKNITKKEKELYIDIGNRYVRLNIANFKGSNEELNNIFIKSNSKKKGNIKSFKRKIQTLRNLTMNNMFMFNIKELDIYLTRYIKKNYPIVSHSKTYKEAYDPHYRIVLKKYIKKYGE